MSTLTQTPIRLLLSPVSNPPDSPVDDNTGLAAQWWRGGAIALQVGIFDALGESVDLTNVTAMQLVMQATPTSPNVLLNKSVLAASIIPTITAAAWADGSAQQFTFNLLNGETDFDLGGELSAEFWLSIRAYTDTGTVIVYGAGYVTIYNPGAALPLPKPGLVSLHTQTSAAAGSITVTPTSVLHTEQVTFTGAATVRNILVDPTDLSAGSRINLALVFGAVTNGVTVNIYNTDTDGTLLFTFIRAGDEPNALFELVADGASAFLKVEQLIPAFYVP